MSGAGFAAIAAGPGPWRQDVALATARLAIHSVPDETWWQLLIEEATVIKDVWVVTVRPGMDWVGAIARPFQQAAQRHGVKLQWLVPDCGATGKAIAVFEWASHSEREKFTSAYPEEIRAIFPKEKDHFDLSTAEHYYYRVVE